jgi:hypothetical protein
MKSLKRFRNWIALLAVVAWNYLLQHATVKPRITEEISDKEIAEPSCSATVVTELESPPAVKPVTALLITSQPAPKALSIPASTASPVAIDAAPPTVKPSAPEPVIATHVQPQAKPPAVQAARSATPANGKNQTSAMSEQSAQRLARVLISEIKLYYMSKMGGQDQAELQNLYDLLKDPIDKSRQHYKQRVGAQAAMPDYFHGELVKTLCAGDASRLGPNYVSK